MPSLHRVTVVGAGSVGLTTGACVSSLNGCPRRRLRPDSTSLGAEPRGTPHRAGPTRAVVLR